MLTVRPALPDDADAVAAVHVRAWQQAYSHLLPAEFLTALDVDARARRWRQIIADPTVDVVVAADSGSIVGWATAGPGRDDEPVRERELEGIYVLAEHHGSGAGQALLDAAVGSAPAFLWMADDNPRAERFYRRNGFERDGTVKTEHLGPHAITAARMVR